MKCKLGGDLLIHYLKWILCLAAGTGIEMIVQSKCEFVLLTGCTLEEPSRTTSQCHKYTYQSTQCIKQGFESKMLSQYVYFLLLSAQWQTGGSVGSMVSS